MQREWERAEDKVTKLKEEETHLLEEIQKLTQPAAASAAATEDVTVSSSEETPASEETTA
jgi:cell division protein FtsB